MNALRALHDVRSHIIQTAHAIIGGKGFAAVGLNQILQAAGVPKGSFYHYFGSKEAFGEALLQAYFADYMERLELVLTQPGLPASDRLMDYWHHWLETQANHDPKGKCLTVKLSAEVSDLSEGMRSVLQRGTDGIIRRLAVLYRGGNRRRLPGIGPAARGHRRDALSAVAGSQPAGEDHPGPGSARAGALLDPAPARPSGASAPLSDPPGRMLPAMRARRRALAQPGQRRRLSLPPNATR